MVVLKIILGILMVLCGCSILTIPAFSSITLCWMISFFMLIAGIASIIMYIEAKNAEKVAAKAGVPTLGVGVGGLIFGIAAIIISILARSSTIGEELFIRLVSTLFGLWIVLEGISMITVGSGMKKVALPGWLASIILGILLAIAGIICIVDCYVGLTTMGVMFGISMMMAGFSFILD